MKSLSERLASAERGLGYHDVLLAPRVSPVDPQQVDLSTVIGPIRLRRPLISASMRRTGSLELFLGMARAGGLAIIPQWPLPRRMAMVRAIKAHRAKDENETADSQYRLRAAVSFSADEVAAVPEFVSSGADAIVLESAHGGSSAFLEAAACLRKIVPPAVALIAGNVAAADAAEGLRDAGVDAIKVGVGVGSVCTTTDVTGVGMPQVSALAEVSDGLRGTGIAIIADGGIRTGGDVVKSFALGAAAACSGSLFAQSLEADGETRTDAEGRAWRKYAANFYPSLAYWHEGRIVAGEGIEGWIPIVGSVATIVERLSAAIRAGMAYIGAAAIPDVSARARFILPASAVGAEEQDRHHVIVSPSPLARPDDEPAEAGQA